MTSPLPRRPQPGRVLWLYALATLDREGSVYGYSLADRIAARTDGAWRPGAGAIYPALRSLVTRGAASVSTRGARRVYSITAEGRRLLRRIREQMAGPGPGAPDLSLLWAEIAGTSDPGEHMLRHLRRHLDALDAYLARQPDARHGVRPLREDALAELIEATRRLRNSARGRRSSVPGARRRVGHER